MAIVWRDGPKAGTVEYESAVLYVGRRTIRVMSDVWEDETYATVWDGEREKDVVLSDWAYAKLGGGWTKDFQEATGDTSRVDYFRAEAAVDATPEVIADRDEWLRMNRLIKDTESRWGQSLRPAFGKQVRVFKGRKVPLGEGYQITAGPFMGDYSSSVVHLRDRDGKAYRYVNADNVEVANPDQYIEGPVGCSECRCEFPSWQACGMRAVGAEALGRDCGPATVCICGECRKKALFEGRVWLRMPESAKYAPGWLQKPFNTKAVDSIERAFLLALDEDPENLSTWMVYADRLEERGETDLAHAIRVMTGCEQVKKPSYRKKDLKFTPWQFEPQTRGYDCEVTGFPPFSLDSGRTGVAIKIHASGRMASVDRRHSFKVVDDLGENYFGYDYQIPSGLKRVLKQALPPVEAAVAAG